MNFELLDLRAFLAVFDQRSFHKAAELLHLSQSAVSRRIYWFEVKIGSRLIERSTQRVAPTSAGIKFEPMARWIVEEFDSLISGMNGSDARQTGRVTIGVIPSAVAYLLSSVMTHFRARFPQMRISMVDQGPEELRKAVVRGDVEFAISTGVVANEEVTFTALSDDPYVVVYDRRCFMKKETKFRWSDLQGYPLIRVGGVNGGSRLVLEKALADEGVHLDWFCEVNNLDTALRLAQRGVGVSVLPAMAVQQRRSPSLEVKLIESPSVCRRIGIVERRQGRLSPPAQCIKELLMATRSEARDTQ